MNPSKTIARSVFIVMLLAAAVSYAETQKNITTSSDILSGGVSTCNLENNHCGPAIPISETFPSLTDSEFGYHIDAAVKIPNKNMAYLFWNGYFRYFNLETWKPEGRALPIGINWHGLSGTEFAKGINAAISDHKSNTIYLIRGSEVVSCTRTAICGQIKPIAEQWPSLVDSEFGSHIDTAANIPGTNESYLFRDGYYIKFNMDKGQPEGKPKSIGDNWSGLSGTTFAKKITAAITDPIRNAILLYSVESIPGNIPGGGWQGCDSGCATIGMAWKDNDGKLTGYITAEHLGGGVGDTINSVAWNNVPAKTLCIQKTTAQADIKMIDLIDKNNIFPGIITTKGKRYIVSDWAREGDIGPGQPVCQSGWDAITQSKIEGIVCGTITKVGPPEKCQATGTGKSSCAVTFHNETGFACGPGDAGAAVWSTKRDGSVKLLGTVSRGDGSSCTFEPTYAISQIFGGSPYTR